GWVPQLRRPRSGRRSGGEAETKTLTPPLRLALRASRSGGTRSCVLDPLEAEALRGEGGAGAAAVAAGVDVGDRVRVDASAPGIHQRAGDDADHVVEEAGAADGEAEAFAIGEFGALRRPGGGTGLRPVMTEIVGPLVSFGRLASAPIGDRRRPGDVAGEDGADGGLAAVGDLGERVEVVRADEVGGRAPHAFEVEVVVGEPDVAAVPQRAGLPDVE